MTQVDKKHRFIKKWKKTYKNILKLAYPEISKKEIDVFLDKIIDDNIEVPEGIVDNNYVHKSIKVDLLTLIDWIHNKQLICGGHGVFFKNYFSWVGICIYCMPHTIDKSCMVKDLFI